MLSTEVTLPDDGSEVDEGLMGDKRLFSDDMLPMSAPGYMVTDSRSWGEVISSRLAFSLFDFAILKHSHYMQEEVAACIHPHFLNLLGLA